MLIRASLFIALIWWLISCKGFFDDAQRCYNFGHDILLIINFNTAHYNNIDFLKKMYEPFFPHMVFYGPEKNYRVHSCPTIKKPWGYYAYASMTDAMQRYPDYNGYLWINDDCALFVWNLINGDKNKIWAPSVGFPNVAAKIAQGVYNIKTNKAAWYWWTRYYMNVKTVYNKLTTDYRSTMAADFGADNIVCGPAEIFYIPTLYKNNFIELATLCSNNNLFIEIAFPLVIACLERLENKENINMAWGLQDKKMKRLTNTNNPKNFWHNNFFYKNNISCCHPIKFSDKNNQQFMERLYACTLGRLHDA